MIIRKLFKFEGAHIVRNCSSDRCKKSIHGHSYIVEVKLESNKLDNGGMVVDFGLLKSNVGDLIDSFDHAYSMWNKETDEYKSFMLNNSDRYVIMPVSPSAENYSLMFAYVINKMIENTDFNNGEGNVKLHSVIVHETATGYAESTMDDVYSMWKFNLDDIVFSDQIVSEWKKQNMWDNLKSNIKYVNPIVNVTH